MRSPTDMRIIQIDITNACIHQCSNCTRFCGHHKKNFFMDWETFKKSVKSLEEFDRCIGIMGGEPTLHPQFERFAEYLLKNHPLNYLTHSTRRPIVNFPRYIRDKNYFIDECLNQYKGIGLWTSLTKQYCKNFELIQDVFSYQSINDHNNPSLHQPLLVSRKELGISDATWIPMRNNCLIQNMWSASITPKGAFFCEVAAALDMLFDGPGGWPIEPGWWRRKPEDFGYQLNWCEICGGALFHSGRLASEEIDDISPMLYEKLKEIDSPKVKLGKIVIMNMSDPQIGQTMPDTKNRYLTNFDERLSRNNTILFPDYIDAIVFCEHGDMIIAKLDEMQKSFNRIVLFTLDQELADKLRSDVMGYEKVTVISSQLNSFGRTFNKAVKATNGDWICLIAENSQINGEFIDRLKHVVVNPGVLYSLSSQRGVKFFHPFASALRNSGYDGVSLCDSLSMFYALWPEDKQVTLEDDFNALKNPDLDEWNSFLTQGDIENQPKLLQTLDKIKKDYEELNNSNKKTEV